MGRKILITQSQKDTISDIEILDGLFSADEIQYGRVLDANTVKIGRFTNLKLHGYCKYVMPNNVTKEGLFENGKFESHH